MLREWLIDALALVVGASAVLYYQPEGFIAGLIVFVGAYTLTHSLQAELEMARGHLRTSARLPRAGAPSGHPYDGAGRHQRHGVGLHVLAARNCSNLLGLGIVVGDGYRVSTADRAVCGVAGATCDQDCCADHARRLACAETAPDPNEPAPQIEAASNTKAER